jgi:hypothetical protein
MILAAKGETFQPISVRAEQPRRLPFAEASGYKMRLNYRPRAGATG